MTATAHRAPLPQVSNLHVRLLDALQPALLVAAFWVACFFYSVGYNLLMLQVAVLGPLLCLLVAGPRRFAGLLEREKLLALCALGTILVLGLHYNLFSISREASYPYTWVLACLPLWVLALGVTSKPHAAALGVAGSVVLMALVSAVRFLLDGQRAHDPLADTNNYATLVYLTWIPLTHWLLLGLWRRPSSSGYAAIAALTLVMTLAIFATGSRAGGAVVAGALLAWTAWSLWHRHSLWPVALVLAAAVAGYVILGLFEPQLQRSVSGEGGLESDLGVRWLMLSAAFQIAADNGLNGSGLYTFSLLYPEYRSLLDQSTSGVLVHNDYAQLLVEGGVWFLLPVVVLGLATLFTLLRSFDRSAGLGAHHGCALALGAAMAHATINFVFYSLALCSVLGVLCYFAFRADPTNASTTKRPSLAVGATWLAGLLFAAASWFYLALDTYAFGVFSGQPSMPSAAETRRDAEAALEFARMHRALNDNRSIPALGEALLLAREPYSDRAREETLAAFRRAIAKHPWSIQARLALVDYIVRNRISSRLLAADEQPEYLLLQALRDAPADMAVVRSIVAFYKLVGRPDAALQHIRDSVFPWVELLFRRDPRSYGELVAMVEDLAPPESDALAELAALREALDKVERDYQPDVWFMRWRAGSG